MSSGNITTSEDFFEMPSPEAVGGRLREIQGHLGVTQAELARRLGCSQSYLSDVMRGQKMISRGVIFALSLRFGVNIHWLLSGEGGMLGTENATPGGAGMGNLPTTKSARAANKGLATSRHGQIAHAVGEGETVYPRESPKADLVAALRRVAEVVEAHEVLDPEDVRDLMRRAAEAEREPPGSAEGVTPPVLHVVSGRDISDEDARAIEGEGEMIRVVPILDGRIAAGAPLEVADAERVGWAFCYAPHVPHAASTSCIRVAGDSMNPVIPDGALVGVDHAVRDVREMAHKPGEPPRAAIRVDDDGGGCVVRNVRLVGERMLLCEPQNKAGDFPEFSFDLGDPDLPNPVVGQVVWWYVSAL